MSLDHIVPLLSPAISFCGFLLVIVQLRRSTKQRALDSLVKLYDINRQLLTLGFSHPELFDILADSEKANPILERRYLQQMFNHFALIFSYMYESVFNREIKDSLIREVSDFLTMKNAQRHWPRYKMAYPVSFQKFVDDLIEKVEPPEAAQLSSGI